MEPITSLSQTKASGAEGGPSHTGSTDRSGLEASGSSAGLPGLGREVSLGVQETLEHHSLGNPRLRLRGAQGVRATREGPW